MQTRGFAGRDFRIGDEMGVKWTRVTNSRAARNRNRDAAGKVALARGEHLPSDKARREKGGATLGSSCIGPQLRRLSASIGVFDWDSTLHVYSTDYLRGLSYAYGLNRNKNLTCLSLGRRRWPAKVR